MCGITGIYYFNKEINPDLNQVKQSIATLGKRGPDGNGIYAFQNVALGHTRLAVIDVSEAANQPFSDESGQYTIVFNGEFYNYQEHKEALLKKGYRFRSTSDTEVLLYLYIDEGPKCLEKINGFFAFAIHNKKDGSLFIARDRIGIKPLLVYQDTEKLVFASEMKAIQEYSIPKTIDFTSLFLYFQMNYIPPNQSIFENVSKLEPGCSLYIENAIVKKERYYHIPNKAHESSTISYHEAKLKLKELLNSSIEKRLISDVPLGAFLSGGIDSSIIVALASRLTDKLNTFSIGFKDQPFFDETYYANLVAKKYNTNHTVFSLSNQDLYQDLDEVLEYIDEPFADSSAIAVHILSKYTRQNVTVALSGDGADEMFAGYNKHRAHYISQKNNLQNTIIKNLQPFLSHIPQSRNAKIPNLIRQLNKLGIGLKANQSDRYFLWCSLFNKQFVDELLIGKLSTSKYEQRVNNITSFINNESDINDILYSDMHTVLQADMLRKVDSMSMANSLEVRTPFLDHQLVDFVSKLPAEYKINKGSQKRILKDAFKNELPIELITRGKHGFEVPLLPWFKNELNSKINNYWLADELIYQQKIFNPQKIKDLKRKVNSSNPGDVQAVIWALIVFQHWWIKNFN